MRQEARRQEARRQEAGSEEVSCLGGEVAAGLELFEEGGHGHGGEEQDHGPEEHVWDVGAVRAAGTALEMTPEHLALLQRQGRQAGEPW